MDEQVSEKVREPGREKKDLGRMSNSRATSRANELVPPNAVPAPVTVWYVGQVSEQGEGRGIMRGE